MPDRTLFARTWMWLLPGAAAVALVVGAYFAAQPVGSGAPQRSDAGRLSADADTGAGAPATSAAAQPRHPGAAPPDRSGVPRVAPRRATRALPPPATPMAGIYAELARRAAAGDHRAACRLGADLQQCAIARQLLGQVEALANAGEFIAISSSGAEPVRSPADLAANLLQQHDRARAMCEGISPAQLAQAFRYQRAAADSGDPALERWLVARPALDAQQFLRDLDQWTEYRKHAQAYVTRALREHRGDDLGLLLLIHAPEGVMVVAPPYRVADESTFLALHAIAVAAGRRIDAPIDRAARQLQAELTPTQQRGVDRAIARLGSRWSHAAGSAVGAPVMMVPASSAGLCGD